MADGAFLVSVVLVAWLAFAALLGRRAPRWRTSNRVLVALALAFVVEAVVLRGLTGKRAFAALAGVVERVETTEPIVALTFDDGPTPAVLPILELLRNEGVRATFFVTGHELTAHPELGRALLEGGHELANHSWSHTRMVGRSSAFVRSELDRTDTAIRAAGQGGAIAFRPPYGKGLLTLPLALARDGRPAIFWDVAPDSDDSGASAELLARRTLDAVRPGSIVLLHVMYDSRETSRAALPAIVAGLKKRGFRFVTVSELPAR